MKKINWSKCLKILVPIFILMGYTLDVWAADGDTGWGGIAKKVTKSFESIGELITAGSYIAGLAFSIGAIMKFKQHKDNPTQVTVGTPIALTFIAAALLFLPSILTATGETLFSDPQTASHTGCTISSTGQCV